MVRSVAISAQEDDNPFDLNGVEARADYIPEADIVGVTSTGDWFDGINQDLLSSITTIIVGPRGCGKTHMMRYTWMQCRASQDLPLAIYVSFNRYLRLEPWMQRRADARRLFNAWVLALIAEATLTVLEKISDQPFDLAPSLTFDRARLKLVIGRLENQFAGETLEREDEDAVRDLTMDRIIDFIRRACQHAGRRRTVLLFDDAALTLTPDFMADFFDVVRTMKQTDIAPKVSVYPATTEYGPRFHVHQEANIIPVWLDLDNEKYVEIMEMIVRLRNKKAADFIKPEVSRMLMYASFGVPRAYLAMMTRLTRIGKQGQPEINRVIQDLEAYQLSEFRSIEQKLPQFKTLIQTGEIFFRRAIAAIAKENVEKADPKNRKNWVLLFDQTKMTALSTRMIKLLIEAGLLFEAQKIMHGGVERQYKKYVPHLAALMSARAFSGGSRGMSLSAFTEYLKRDSVPHGWRRSLTTLLKKNEIEALRFDLPACPNCGAVRLTETQKYCHQCANQLPHSSTFFRLMALPIDKVPILSKWARDRLKEQGIATIQDLMSFEDPGSELRKIHRVGPKRAEKYIGIIEAHVSESLLS